MKLFSFFALFTAIAFPYFSFSQEPAEVKKLHIKEVYISGGLYTQGINKVNFNQFRQIVPESELFPQDLTRFSQPFFYNPTSINGAFNVLLGLEIANKEKTAYKKSPQIRIGLSHFTTNNLTGYLRYSDNRRVDTFTSNQSGNQIYVDSVYHESYNFDLYSDEFRLDASIIYRTNPEARFTLFGGAGITAGVGISKAIISHYDSREREFIYENGERERNYGYYGYSSAEREQHQAKIQLGGSVYFPMGIDFRLANKNEFLRKLHLFYEVRPCLNITHISELDQTFAQKGLQQGLGVRVQWD